MEKELFFSKSYGVIVTLMCSIILVGCGSYDVATYDDGIYASQTQRPIIVNEPAKVEQEKQVSAITPSQQAYFAQKSAEYAQVLNDGEVLTDVDNYSSQAPENYDSWGNDPNVQTNVTIVNNGWNNWNARRWGYDPFWDWRYRNSVMVDPFYNNWGWNDPYYCLLYTSPSPRDA